MIDRHTSWPFSASGWFLRDCFKSRAVSGAWVRWKSYPIKTKLGYHKSPIPGDGRGLAEGEELESAAKGRGELFQGKFYSDILQSHESGPVKDGWWLQGMDAFWLSGTKRAGAIKVGI